jgi:hypothetical protein
MMSGQFIICWNGRECSWYPYTNNTERHLKEIQANGDFRTLEKNHPEYTWVLMETTDG